MKKKGEERKKGEGERRLRARTAAASPVLLDSDPLNVTAF